MAVPRQTERVASNASSGWLPVVWQELHFGVPRAWVKSGAGGAAEVAWSEYRATRTEAREPKTRRTDAFPRNGAAGPGCQVATVADGRRETETGETRWRKGASRKKPIIRLLTAVVILTFARNRRILQKKDSHQGK